MQAMDMLQVMVNCDATLRDWSLYSNSAAAYADVLGQQLQQRRITAQLLECPWQHSMQLTYFLSAFDATCCMLL
jgi:hypothetical protein